MKEITVTVPAEDLARYRSEAETKEEAAYQIAKRLLAEGVFLWEPYTLDTTPDGALVVSGSGHD